MVPRYIGLDLHAQYIHGCEWNPGPLTDIKNGTSGSPIPLTGGRSYFPS